MTKNLCSVSSCPNVGRYARICGHLQDEEKKSKLDIKDYLKVREVFLKEHPICGVGTCKKKSNEVHHKKGRGKKYLCNPKTFLAVCRHHHRFLEEHPIFAKENGYSESRHSKTIL